MERLDGGSTVPPHLAGGIVALGNFDGFHLGHQAVVGQAVARARAEGRPALVATFDPHPVRHFRPDTPPFRLTTLDQRERLFAAAGVDAMVVFAFDAALAALSAEAFAERLAARLQVAGVVTGEDFTFGQGKRGDVAMLAALGTAHGFTAETVGAVTLDGETVSSSRIRELLRAGDPRGAARLLTRPFAIQGTVQHGDKLGRTIGYPTANLDMGKYLRPAYGIYAVTARLPDGRQVQGAANLGIRPTFDPPKELLEPYFFDFSGDLYGQTIEVALIDYIRPEAKFDSLDALTAQMEADCAEARARLSAGARAL
ncbi:bifunctional riboflavin kinase/FMN adenylyltransferase [Sphingomonas melonis TY]|jgi:riboflavin kinase / FMN adenylyltransferase|uniref:Riboflavin biosynthesis protein n=1 Tax=Sphingomonas melonis TY TaxID=621456 RepID=A0A175Y1M4_9SPHN|nr:MULTISPECIES: bifunctional riboflavin kinase/FAD synthetase [Sphingomonas]AOW23118.1 riboflavin biosynthesis protein RibF [Sphingomonas melonis TY]ATI56549.1 bifunctional riboflavin kinase/FMN adenylyltransferase [Sphingomonas melonis]KZB94359.1 bifunctional riboflavin kinase/FMN adenylyltransferase [Sphingomonas melonis TY]MBI0530055.1 bifunctional riboflavin kinase/FAD synthetase [Sphingomonas sp. TX0522]MBX8845436.1 bifunctional riboflavin kinase/FAD synthetase [Sphingomonas melonis]